MPTAKALIIFTALAFTPLAAHAQYSDGVIKIGVMNDQSGTYADLSGQGSVWAARKAVEDFCKASTCHDKIEVIFADHQNKPDVGSNIVRQWYDVDKVDVVVDVPTSSVALAVNNIAKEKNKVFLVSGVGSYRQSLHPKYHSLDLRHVGACQRHRTGNRQDRRRQLVLFDSRLRFRPCARAGYRSGGREERWQGPG